METKYYTLWAKPCSVGRKTLDVNSREGYTLNVPSSPLVFGPTRRLTAVKEVLYNPCLPTLRRMDMDEVLGKLTMDHSRHSTPCSRGDFQNYTVKYHFVSIETVTCFHGNNVGKLDTKNHCSFTAFKWHWLLFIV